MTTIGAVRRPRRARRGVTAMLLACTLLAAAAAAQTTDRGGFTIDTFHTDLTVRANADLIVEERLEVDFSEPRHGIYRTIPVRYTDRSGFAFSLGFHLLSVVDDGGLSHHTQLSNQGRYVEIRIGDPERTVEGRVTYVLRYRIRRAIGHFSSHDELYWNATGHEWNAPVRRASAAVHLPAALTDEEIEAAGYTGRFGSDEQAVRIAVARPGEVRYEVARPLEPLEGLTVVAAWPLGHVHPPGAVVRSVRVLVDNWILGAPFVAIALLWRRYRAVGRDPAGPESVMVRYEPPEGVSPAGVGAIVDERVDVRDITATIVDLARRGHLVIRVETRTRLLGLLSSDDTVLERRSPPAPDALLPHERLVLNALFASGPVVNVATDLKDKFYRRLPAIRAAIYDELVEAGFFASSPETVRQRYRWLAGVAGGLVFAAGALWASWRGAIFPTAGLVPVLAGLATGLVCLGFARAMPRRTRTGVTMRAWARGFEEFVERVDGDRLADTDPRRAFEVLLPYAMSLGIATEWAARFEGIYERALPAWYAGSHAGGGFSTRDFESSLSSAMSQTGQSLVAAPRSSGSGGGGFSGGGGGGGGGGSW